MICIWRDPAADVTGLRLALGHVAIEDGEAYLEELDDQGYDCEDRYDGQWCQHISNDTDFGVEEGHTAFLRDDVFIEVRQANFPTNGFLADVVETHLGRVGLLQAGRQARDVVEQPRAQKPRAIHSSRVSSRLTSR